MAEENEALQSPLKIHLWLLHNELLPVKPGRWRSGRDRGVSLNSVILRRVSQSPSGPLMARGKEYQRKGKK